MAICGIINDFKKKSISKNIINDGESNGHILEQKNIIYIFLTFLDG